MFQRRWMRRGAGTIAVFSIFAVLATAASVIWAHIEAHGHVYSANDVPAAPVALVLGDLVYADRKPSPFLLARLRLAERLYETGKVRAILVSGDNSRPDYDEPDIMRAWLVDHGIPAVAVVADYAGFDTYDSCVRAGKIFGVHRAIVVSQTYHLDRAIAICRNEGVVADGVGDDSVAASQPLNWVRATLREQVADVKAVLDVASGRPPVFLGPPVPGIRKALAAH